MIFFYNNCNLHATWTHKESILFFKQSMQCKNISHRSVFVWIHPQLNWNLIFLKSWTFNKSWITVLVSCQVVWFKCNHKEYTQYLHMYCKCKWITSKQFFKRGKKMDVRRQRHMNHFPQIKFKMYCLKIVYFH